MELPLRSSSSDEAMSLYTTGFNAWNQLNFESSSADQEPNDLFTFTKVLTGNTINNIITKISYTAGKHHNSLPLLLTVLILSSTTK